MKRESVSVEVKAPPGRHLLADFSGMNAETLRDSGRIMGCLRAALDKAGYHVVNEVEHKFEGGGEGFTGILILSESHAAVHTYPEHGYLAIDLFSCGSNDPHPVLDALAVEFLPGRIEINEIRRSPEARS